MSAEALRRAAALMRERAKAATPGPWTVESTPRNDNTVLSPWTLRPGGRAQSVLSESVGAEDAAHIASWHPAAALAVADLLDGAAGHVEYTGRLHDDDVVDALAVARTYLNEQETP